MCIRDRNKVAQEIAEREAKLSASCNLDAAEMSNDCNVLSVASDEPGRSPHDLVNEASQCSDVTYVIDAQGVVNKQAENQKATNFDGDTYANLGNDDAESSCPQTVRFSELQYANLTIEGHEGVVTALKDPGAKISLVKQNLSKTRICPRRDRL